MAFTQNLSQRIGQLKKLLQDGERVAKEKKHWEIRRRGISEAEWLEKAQENRKRPLSGVLCCPPALPQKAVKTEPAHLPGWPQGWGPDEQRYTMRTVPGKPSLATVQLCRRKRLRGENPATQRAPSHLRGQTRLLLSLRWWMNGTRTRPHPEDQGELWEGTFFSTQGSIQDLKRRWFCLKDETGLPW